MDNNKTSMEIPEDFTSPEILYDKLKKRILEYHPSSDLEMVEKAYKLAYEAHKEQKRKSGEPYIIHPVCVALILADLELDIESIVAGLLHDVVEDTVVTQEELEKEFGSEVALLVDGVTKLTKLNYSADKVELQAENLRKMFLAMAKDIRVILIKLAVSIICVPSNTSLLTSSTKKQERPWISMRPSHRGSVFQKSR